MTLMTIGKVARFAGVGVETIRFYEREGLIERPARPVSGFRHYPEGAISRIRFVRKAKELGFTLKEIRGLLELRIDPEQSCGDVRAQAETKIADIESKIRTLRRMKKALVKLTAACDGQAQVGECPILVALEDTKS